MCVATYLVIYEDKNFCSLGSSDGFMGLYFRGINNHLVTGYLISHYSAPLAQ